MKVLLFNCHGQQKINPSLFSAPTNKSVTFLCKEGKTLSVNQVKEFIDSVLNQPDLNSAITNSNSIEVEKAFTPKEILDKYNSLKKDKENITSELLQKITQLQIDKVEDFLLQTFGQHNKIDFVVPDLILKHDDVPNGVASQIVTHLKQKNFIAIGITIYGDQTTEYDQLYLMCNVQELTVNKKVDVVYITPSQHINPLSLSCYLENFNHAYLVYNKSTHKLLEAFLDLQSNHDCFNNATQYVGNNPNCDLYDFGQDNSDIVIGACREFDSFDFGYQI